MMSIRLTPDGHFFPEPPAADRSSGAAEMLVEVEVVSRKSVLVPAGVVAAGDEAAAACLALCGMAPEAGETVVRSEPSQGRVAVMAIPAAAFTRLPEGCRFTSPLLPAADETAGVVLHHTAGLLYIKVCGPEGLLLAETVRCETGADTLYYAAALADRFPTREWTLRLSGAPSDTGQKGLCNLLKGYFKKIVCA